ncbi:hypothetical protein CCACVL1_20988 [Corchorus capsularis]|uniref:Uncharacterized protein n=1 Tax=Corchorus capsularis TaxID=210143 RepID=A0A1R3H8V5_COCAP|nr:hypothetical protein CCACVL1_20988 [Corchorus capsularis]
MPIYAKLHADIHPSSTPFSLTEPARRMWDPVVFGNLMPNRFSPSNLIVCDSGVSYVGIEGEQRDKVVERSIKELDLAVATAPFSSITYDNFSLSTNKVILEVHVCNCDELATERGQGFSFLKSQVMRSPPLRSLWAYPVWARFFSPVYSSKFQLGAIVVDDGFWNKLDLGTRDLGKRNLGILIDLGSVSRGDFEIKMVAYLKSKAGSQSRNLDPFVVFAWSATSTCRIS